jgi:HEAT repeat protein
LFLFLTAQWNAQCVAQPPADRPDVDRLASAQDIRSLAVALKHEEPQVRAKALDALRRIASDKQSTADLKPALLPVAEAFRDESPEVASRAGSALESVAWRLRDYDATNSVVPVVVSALEDSRAEVRIEAAETLARLPRILRQPDALREAIRPLTWMLGDPHVQARLRAATALVCVATALGDKASAGPGVRALVEAIPDEDADVRSTAEREMWHLAQYLVSHAVLRELVSGLVEALADNRPLVRASAVKALESVMRTVAEETPRRILEEQSRRAAGDAEGRTGARVPLGPEDDLSAFADDLGLEAAVPYLIKVVEGDEASVPDLAARALWHVARLVKQPGPLEAAFRPLIDAWCRGDARGEAASALSTIAKRVTDQAVLQRALDLLVTALAEEDHGTAPVSLRLLGAIGSRLQEDGAAGRAVEALKAALSHPHVTCRRQAASALGEVLHSGSNPAARELAARALMGALDDEDAFVREAAASLGNVGADALGPTTPAAIRALTEALQDGTQSVRNAAMLSLGRIAGGLADRSAFEAALRPVLEALRDRDSGWREYAMQALWVVAEDVKKKEWLAGTVPLLIEALRDPNETVRVVAASVLEFLGTAEGKAALEAYHKQAVPR